MDYGESDRCNEPSAMNAASRRMLAMVAALALTACAPPYYTSAPIEAWVVDADTGAPIEGAVVTANWQLVAASLDTGGRKLRQLEVMETVSDKDGRFYFPGFTRINFTLDELRDEAPQILIFKSGHRYARLGIGRLTDKEPRPPAPIALPPARRIPLEKGDPDVKKYAFDLGFLTTSVMNIYNSGDIAKVPRLVHALGCERMRLLAVDATAGRISIPGSTGSEINCEK